MTETTTNDAGRETLSSDELRTLFLFEELDPLQLAWLSCHGRVEQFAADTMVYVEGDEATCFYVLLDGTVVLYRRVQGDDVEVNRTDQRGVYSGATQAWLPSTETVTYAQSMRVATDARFFVVPADEIGDALREWFPMAVHLLEGLYAGMRSSNTVIGQRERLLSLGQLTAGLTHELNNPAAAAVRATATLRERVAAMRGKLAHLAGGKVDPDSLVKLTALQEEAIERGAKAPKLTAMQEADLEDEITDWLDDHGCRDGWQIAPVFVAAGLGAEWLDEIAGSTPDGLLEPGLRWIAYALETEQLMGEIEDSTERISALVGAAKQYSQMDRAAHQIIDVHDGLDSTLVMLGRKIGEGIEVVKEYDRTLPRIPAFAGELNQVWTNLIDNAVQAMEGHGRLTIRTQLDGDAICVEICDTGPGVPADIRERIFEPFFTTKGVGEGTGLGLDISWRIVVKKHKGDLRVVSEPGDTRFQVRLPFAERRSAAASEDATVEDATVEG